MKLQAERIEGSNAIARHGPGGVVVGNVEYRTNVVVPWKGDVLTWSVANFDALDQAHFDQLAGLEPELIVFGSGQRLRFPSPRFTAGLMKQRIGVESMDTAAACRTYNVLLAEGRAVVAALLFDTTA